MSLTAVLFIFIGLFLSIVLMRLKDLANRKKACFKMYAVRDSLILLVAENKLNEDSKVFQYYYKRVNSLLAHAPNIGMDDVAQSLIKTSNGDFEKALKKSENELKEILKLREVESPEVREVISQYYSVSRFMIFAHSNLLRLVYITFIRGGLLTHYLTKWLPIKFMNQIKVLQYTDQETSLLKNYHA
jgi:hypothetical protein